MAIYYPNPTSHPWNEDVVGGSAGNPKIFLLEEENKIDNGYFRDNIINWSLTSANREAFSEAMRGSYVCKIESGGKIHQAITKPDNLILLTGYVRVTEFIGFGESQAIDIYIYPKNDATDTGIPANYFKLTINPENGGASANEWIPFYMVADTATWNPYTYLHIQIEGVNQGSNDVYVDDLRLYPITEMIDLDCPQTLKLVWQRESDADYKMFNGDMKSYVKGWRPKFSIGYEYCSREQLIKDINISESMFSFFVPQDDGLMGIYTRMTNDFDSSYFKNKFVGHSQALELPSVFLQRYKNKQYGISYYTPTFV
jgi:hypothetical protein